MRKREELNRRSALQSAEETPEGKSPPLEERPFSFLDDTVRNAETEGARSSGATPNVESEMEQAVQSNLRDNLRRTSDNGTLQLGPTLESEALLPSQPLRRESEALGASEPMSGVLGYKPFIKVNEEGEVVDERIESLTLRMEEEVLDEEAIAEQEDLEKQEQLERMRRRLLIPGEEKPEEELLEEPIPPSMVQPRAPMLPPTQYQLETQRLWSQVPVRQPQTSQFGPGVNPQMVPFERTSVKNPGMYSSFQRPRTGGQSDSTYQYRGPRLYSIGESEYDSGTDYNSLPYYRR